MVEFDGRWEIEDYRQANALHRSGMLLIPALSLTVAALIAVLGLWSLFYRAWLVSAVALLCLGALFYVLKVAIPARLERVFAQQRELSLPFHMALDDKGLHFSNEMSRSERPWGFFTKWVEGRDLFLLYISDLAFIMVPKRYLDVNGMTFLRERLRENKVPEK